MEFLLKPFISYSYSRALWNAAAGNFYCPVLGRFFFALFFLGGEGVVRGVYLVKWCSQLIH